MADAYLWGLVAVNVAWLALNTWHTAMNNRQADDNLRQARETAALIEKARRIAGVAGVDDQTERAQTPTTRKQQAGFIELLFALVILAASVFAICALASWKCKGEWADSGFRSRWSLSTGCRIQRSDRTWIPASAVRDLPATGNPAPAKSEEIPR